MCSLKGVEGCPEDFTLQPFREKVSLAEAVGQVKMCKNPKFQQKKQNTQQTQKTQNNKNHNNKNKTVQMP